MFAGLEKRKKEDNFSLWRINENSLYQNYFIQTQFSLFFRKLLYNIAVVQFLQIKEKIKYLTPSWSDTFG